VFEAVGTEPSVSVVASVLKFGVLIALGREKMLAGLNFDRSKNMIALIKIIVTMLKNSLGTSSVKPIFGKWNDAK
jgi:hypothetical protein